MTRPWLFYCAAALLALIGLLQPAPLAAQVATLVADRITFGDGTQVVAEGNVEILQGGRRVKAERITYDEFTEDVLLEGDVIVTDAETGVVLIGERAELGAGFEEGVVQGARFLLEEQLQIAAAELKRVDGRYTQLYKGVASSCRVCGNKAPLWQIRAERVIHDQEERQLYFQNARFELGGVPVAYLPRLRMPDPTQTRSTGLLIPKLQNSTTLGLGIKVPYFIALGDQTDLLLRPYVSSETRTLEGRVRRAFSFGRLELEGAISQDDLTDDALRAYVFAEGRFRLPQDFRLNLDLRYVSDEAYLLAYGYSDLDRLPNQAEITRTRRDEHITLQVETLQALRAAEIPIEDTIATLIGRFAYQRRFSPAGIGGQAQITFDIEGHERQADEIDAAQRDACVAAGIDVTLARDANQCNARDALRAGLSAEWRRSWVNGQGLQMAVEGALSADAYWINQDSDYEEFLLHATPTAAVELRWPLARTTARGARDLIEPVMQIAWTDSIGADVPNEDSKLVEFDEGNLLSLSKFPGSDVYERGWRATLGANLSRQTARGRIYRATIGRLCRAEDLDQFTRASGLDSETSDWLVAAQVKTGALTLTNRSLFDNRLNFAKSETQVAWSNELLTAQGSYIWVVDDPAEGRTGDTSEVNLAADLRIDRHWRAKVNGRYDGNASEPIEAGAGLSYTNECVNVDFSVSRRFTSSTNLEASTDYGLSVSLNGFGRDGRSNARNCQVSG